MSITKEQQQALDDALVPREQRLRIGNSFLISLSAPAIYMHAFWATVSFHKQCIKFKLNKKNHSFDMETFRDMLQICPNLPGQKFVDPPFEEEILAFIRKLGYTGDIKSLSDVKVDTLHQPWRTFGTIINKCLSGKVTGLDQLRISQAQIIWGMYYQKNVDYVYLLWEDLVYQIKNKESEAYKTYYDFATRKVIPKPKYVYRSTREKTDQAPKASLDKRLKAIAKVAKSGKKKLPAQGLETLSEIALFEADQMKLITKRSKTQFHGSHANGSGANEGTGVSPGVPDVPTYGSEDEQISWKSNDEDDDDEVNMRKDDNDNADNEDDDDQDDDNEQAESDNDGDNFVHPKFSTHDEEVRQDVEDKEEECSDLRVHTPSHFESTDDETYDEVTQGDNVEEEKLDEEKTNEEEEVNKMYNDVNINLEGRDSKMTDALLANVQTTQVIEDTHMIITAVTPEVQQQSSSVSSGFISKMLNPNLDTSIDSILNPNIESTSLVDVLVTTNDEILLHLTSLQNLPTFGSLFKFKDKVKSLEDDFAEFKQINLFAEAVSSILDRFRDEAKAKNEDFINTIDANIKKIIKEQVKVQVKEQVSKILPRIEKSVNEQLKDEVLIRSSNEAKTSHATSLQHMEILSLLKDVEMMRMKMMNPPMDQTEGSKSKTRSTGKSAQAEEQVYTVKDLEEPAHQEFKMGFTKDHSVDETIKLPDCTLARKEDPRKSFNELIDTLLDFSAFVLNQLKVDTLTLELLAGPTFKLMKGSCKSLVELEYFLKEVYKATTDQLDWNNPYH
ncbi:hypothetical protein Tco_1109523 [Tanacetum coccineum]